MGAADQEKQPCPFNVRPCQGEEGVAVKSSCSEAVKKRTHRRKSRKKRVSEPPAAVSQPPIYSFYLIGLKIKNDSRICVLRYDPRRQQTEQFADCERRGAPTFTV
ncbi:unnamed protein product, partial [Dibothriocephalus latus]